MAISSSLQAGTSGTSGVHHASQFDFDTKARLPVTHAPANDAVRTLNNFLGGSNRKVDSGRLVQALKEAGTSIHTGSTNPAQKQAVINLVENVSRHTGMNLLHNVRQRDDYTKREEVQHTAATIVRRAIGLSSHKNVHDASLTKRIFRAFKGAEKVDANDQTVSLTKNILIEHVKTIATRMPPMPILTTAERRNHYVDSILKSVGTVVKGAVLLTSSSAGTVSEARGRSDASAIEQDRAEVFGHVAALAGATYVDRRAGQKILEPVSDYLNRTGRFQDAAPLGAADKKLVTAGLLQTVEGTQHRRTRHQAVDLYLAHEKTPGPDFENVLLKLADPSHKFNGQELYENDHYGQVINKVFSKRLEFITEVVKNHPHLVTQELRLGLLAKCIPLAVHTNNDVRVASIRLRNQVASTEENVESEDGNRNAKGKKADRMNLLS